MTQSSYSKDTLSNVLVDKIIAPNPQDNVQVKKEKIVFGADGSYTDVTSQDPFPVTDANAPEQISQTSTVTQVAASLTSVPLLAQNQMRLGAVFYNNSTANCLLKLGVTASLSSFTIEMGPKSIFILNQAPLYTGEVDGLWDAANGFMQVTELTP